MEGCVGTLKEEARERGERNGGVLGAGGKAEQGDGLRESWGEGEGVNK